MTFMMFLSHGTQDLYPTSSRPCTASRRPNVSYIAILYNVGAIVGAIIFGAVFRIRWPPPGMVAALALSLIVIPFWAFGGRPYARPGAFVMQMGVQGAWGIIPVHLTEVSPDAARGLIPGLAYQLGILFASPTNSIEYALRDRFGYQWAIAGFEIVTIVVLATTLLAGSERRGRSFVESPSPAPEPLGEAVAVR